MYALAILTIFFKHSVSLITTLKYFYKTLLRPRADKLLHLSIAFVYFLFEKEGYINDGFNRSLFKTFVLIWWF